MSQETYESIGKELEKEFDTTSGQMFGKKCLKIENKAFAAFFNEEMVFKLGALEVQQALIKYPDSKNWDPSGKNRAMKDWLQVPIDYKKDWSQLAKQALEFVVSTKK